MDHEFHNSWYGDKNERDVDSIRVGTVTRAVACLKHVLEQERTRWFLWGPAILAAGIASYFCLPIEPANWAMVILGLLAFSILSLRAGGRRWMLLTIVAVYLTGMCIGKIRVETAGPGTLILPAGVVNVSGIIEKIQARSKGGVTLFVRPDVVGTTESSDLPEKIRLIWRGSSVALRVGEKIALKAHFLPRHKPAWPGGYDSGFSNWFKGIGAQGFALSMPEVLSRNESTFATWLENARLAIVQRILTSLPGETGTLAVALITGERGYLDEEVTEALRKSGLAHLLGISGLHMALFAGGVFWFLRSVFALSPYLAINYPIKKWAAVAAIVGGLAYLFISGMGIATQRAFIMISIMFAAVLAERPALSMRNVALAALFILIVRPESVMTVSFHMSFMAVVCLIAVYEWVTEHK
ncbi:MAG: ComEC/Rec2 family competence protein, partial [Hyphomicrobiales bacterium]